MGDWKCSQNKTRSATESDSEDEEQQQEEEEDEDEVSDTSIDFEEIAREVERKKVKQQQFENIMYRCYVAEKKNPWKFA